MSAAPPGAKVLNLKRGLYLARCAYESRHPARRMPPIVEAHFEAAGGDGEVLKRYGAEDLKP